MVATLIFAAGLAAQSPPSDGVLFDGEMEYVLVEPHESFTDIDEITVSVWVKLNESSGIQTFMNRGARGELFTLYLFNDHVRMLVEYGTSGQYRHANTAPPPPNTWVHYTGTYDGQTIRLFVNGTEVHSNGAQGRIPVRDDRLFIGATSPFLNGVDGRLSDVRLYSAALSPSEVAEIYAGGDPAPEAKVLHFTDEDLESLIRSDFPDTPPGEEPEYPFANGTLATTDGFRGIWYINGRRDDGLHKYSGGLGTYPQQHIPIAIYAEEANKTFFTYGGTRKDRRRLLHIVSAYDHNTGKVARPRILLDKYTTDAHDNPTMSIDAGGHIWIFSNAHGTGRPSYIHRSTEPYSIESFNRMVTTNFSYSQPWYFEEHSFVFLHTLYGGGRRLYVENSSDGVDWDGPRLLAAIRNGHYQISWPRGSTIGTAFNYHPDSSSLLGSGLNYRTNLYYMESDDGGHTWRNVQGEILALPLDEIENPALAVEYESQLSINYLKDLAYTADGRPVILHLTTPGWQSGPQNDPRIFTTAEWTGTEWRTRPVTTADNNYDFASLYIEDDGAWRVIGSTEVGPQAYNTGGEMAMWISRNQGASWEMLRQLTQNSEYNHTYPRRPLNAHPDFYALWADGHGREISPSRLYFTTRDGKVFRLPPEIEGDDLWIDPEPLPEPPLPPPPQRDARFLFDSGGFESDALYPPGPLQPVQHGQATWQPFSTPAEIVSAGPPHNKVFHRTKAGTSVNREWLHLPPAPGQILIVDLDVRVSNRNARTLDLSLMADSGSRQAGFLGWGTTPGFLDYYDGDAWVPLLPLDEQWRHVRMVHYFAGPYLNRFDLIVNDVPVADKLRFRHSFSPEDLMTRLRINAAGPAGEWFEIDNLRVRAQETFGPMHLPAAELRDTRRAGNEFSVSFATYAGFLYALEFSNSLNDSEWTTLGVVSGDGTVRTLTDTGSNADRRFYRVRTVDLDD